MRRMPMMSIGILTSLLLAALRFETTQIHALSLRPSSRRETRYFSQQLVAPPLAPLADMSNIESSHHQELPILYTNDPRVVSQWLQEHVDRNGCVLGFDVESVPTAPWVLPHATFLGPATVQLATTRAAMVVHLVKANGRPSRACIPLLQEILENDRILKVGCGVDEDMMELRRSVAYGLDGRGRFELSGIGSAGRGSQMGLQKLVALVLGRHLPKSKKMSASNWSCVPLLPAQIVYSGYDAWAGVAIAEKLAEVDPDRFSMESVQFRLRTTHQGSLMHAELRKRKRKQARKSLSSLMKHRQRRGINMPATSWRLGVIRKLKTVLWQNRPESHDTYELSLLTSMMEPMYGIINAGNSTC